MTAQEIFDKAAVGLLTQKAKSYLVNPNDGTESSTCAYRGVNGKKCAAGFCIEDSLYEKSMERNTVSGVIRRFNLKELAVHEVLLVTLQSIHDGVSIAAWKAELLHLAKTRELSTEKIDNL